MVSIFTLGAAAVVGMIIGGGAIFSLASTTLLRDTLLRNILRSNKDGWVLTQRGTRYTLDPLARDEDSNQFTVERDGDEEYMNDVAGMMHTLEGVPLGLRLEEQRPMVDIDSAQAATAMGTKVADGGELGMVNQPQPAPDIDDLADLEQEDMEERLIIGKKEGTQRQLLYINPFQLRSRVPDLVDLRAVPQAVANDTDPDAPRKAAKNAVEAERSLLTGWDDIKGWAKNISYFMLGAIATYIGTQTNGGGGGGGGGGADAVDVGLTMMPPLVDIIPVVV